VPEPVDLSVLTEEAELALLRTLADLPEVVQVAAAGRSPHKVTRFAEDLAASFHQFYTLCRVVDPDAPALTAARLAVVDATRIVLELALGLVGVGAPQRM